MPLLTENRRHVPVVARSVVMFAVAASTVVLLAGCSAGAATPPVPVPTNVDLGLVDIENGSANGLWYLTGNDAASQVLEAVRRTEGVTMEGTIEEMVPQQSAPPIPGRTIRFTSQGDSSASVTTLSAGAVELEIRIVEGVAYLRGNAAYDANAGIVTGSTFACTSPDSDLVTEWAELTDPAELLSATLIGFELGVLAPAEESTDVATIVIGSGGAPLGTLQVEAAGQPLPRQLLVADQTGSVSVAFTAWGEPAPVAAPNELGPGCA